MLKKLQWPRRQLVANGLACFLVAVALGHCSAAIVLTEDFEDGSLDARITVQTVGTYEDVPAIKATGVFGSTRAFGFGRSTCSSNCFFSYVTTMTITLERPTFISAIIFKEMELFDNWGSDGAIFLDGEPYSDGFFDFGRLPYNDRQPDATFRDQTFQIDRVVTEVQLRVSDITRLSEIYIDDLTLVATSPCGNGQLDQGEECDDGNTENGDGCDSMCQFECTLDLTTEYTAGNLNLNFGIGTQELLTWNTWISFQTFMVPIWTIPIPAIDPPVAIPVSFPLPPLGKIGILTTMTADDGIVCSDWQTVNTGAAP